MSPERPGARETLCRSRSTRRWTVSAETVRIAIDGRRGDRRPRDQLSDSGLPDTDAADEIESEPSSLADEESIRWRPARSRQRTCPRIRASASSSPRRPRSQPSLESVVGDVGMFAEIEELEPDGVEEAFESSEDRPDLREDGGQPRAASPEPRGLGSCFFSRPPSPSPWRRPSWSPPPSSSLF